MNYLVIYPGRFHVFHLGHKAVYDYLVNKYQPIGGSVYIATSDIQSPVTSPFSYSDKVAMLTKMGVPASHIIKVTNPYSIEEYTGNLPDANDTVLIFAVGAKDQKLVKDANGKVVQRPRFNFAPKRDGSPAKVQPLPENLNQCKPVSDKVAYVDVVNTQEFKVQGQTITDASKIRNMYIKGNNADRNQIITDLYGTPDQELRDIFDQKLGVAEKATRFIKEARASCHPGAVLVLEKMLHLERTALNEYKDIVEGEVVPFPGKALPPELNQAQKLAYDLVDAAYNSKGDPRQETTRLRQELQKLGYRVRGAGRGLELVNDQYSFKQLIEPFDYLEEKKH